MARPRPAKKRPKAKPVQPPLPGNPPPIRRAQLVSSQCCCGSATGSPTRPASGRSSDGRPRRTPGRTLTPASGRSANLTSLRHEPGARTSASASDDLRRICGAGWNRGRPDWESRLHFATSYAENLLPLYCHLLGRKRAAGTLCVVHSDTKSAANPRFLLIFLVVAPTGFEPVFPHRRALLPANQGLAAC